MCIADMHANLSICSVLLSIHTCEACQPYKSFSTDYVFFDVGMESGQKL